MSPPHRRYERAIVRWLDVMIFAVAIMVLIGGITRLTGSGLSMTDWRLIGGTVPPLTELDWQERFDRYQGTPQHQIIHPEMTLEGFKGIFWWEYIHRMWGRMLGFLFFFPFLFFALKKCFDSRRMKQLLIALILGGGQGLLGWFMVQSGLVDRPWVSPVRLTAHLLLALFLLALLTWNRLEISTNKQDILCKENKFLWFRRLFPVVVVLFFLQFAFGGVMAGMKAALDYPTFPKMNGQWIPQLLWKSNEGWHNFFENSAFVHFVHRGLGALLLILTTWAAWQGFRCVQGKWKLFFFMLVFMTWFQFLLGVSTVVSSRGGIPVAWGSMHQGGAILLTLILTVCIFVRQKGKPI